MGATKEMYIRIQDELFNAAHQASEGEITNLDALLIMRDHRSEAEKLVEIIKEFESDKITEIANEASQYPEGYKGFQVSVANGRKTFSFKGIPEWENAEKAKKAVEDKYKAMWEAKAKGANTGFCDEETGEEMPLPEVSYGKTFVTVKENKKQPQ